MSTSYTGLGRNVAQAKRSFWHVRPYAALVVPTPPEGRGRHACEIPSGQYDGETTRHGQSADLGRLDRRGGRWGRSGMAILPAQKIARILYRLLWPRPEVSPKPEPEPGCRKPAAPAIRRKSQPNSRPNRISGALAPTSPQPGRAAGSEQPLEAGFSMSPLRAHRRQCSARRVW